MADDQNLDGHLLLTDPKGIPKNLKGTVHPFRYNQEELETLIEEQDIGVIKMEVSRNVGPESGYLEHIRDLATQRGIVLILMSVPQI